MKRDLDKLDGVHFDIVNIGSGIHGAVLALDAVSNGYSVALLEKGLLFLLPEDRSSVRRT